MYYFVTGFFHSVCEIYMLLKVNKSFFHFLLDNILLSEYITFIYPSYNC